MSAEVQSQLTNLEQLAELFIELVKSVNHIVIWKRMLFDEIVIEIKTMMMLSRKGHAEPALMNTHGK